MVLNPHAIMNDLGAKESTLQSELRDTDPMNMPDWGKCKAVQVMSSIKVKHKFKYYVYNSVKANSYKPSWTPLIPKIIYS